jgi:ATP-dependent exoDNAse (exonuclease V) beta subunit
MNLPSDWREREQARGLDHSCIVQAPAGSGKTELLTQRMLALLSRVENPEEVVAITFTRKAAAEMRNRLVGWLQAAAQSNPTQASELQDHEKISYELALTVLENDSVRKWNLLEQPSRLRIRTIDSLCGELARQLPVLSGLGGGQQVVEDASALYRLAASRTMALIENNNESLQQDITRVLNRYNNQYDRLVDLLAFMLANREQWLGHILNSRSGDGFNRQALESSLRILIEAQLETARAEIPEKLLSDLPRFLDFALENDPNDKSELMSLLQACNHGGFIDLPVHAEALEHWKTIIDRLLTATGDKWRSAPDKNAGFPPPSNATGEDRIRFRTFKEDFTDLLDEYRQNDDLRATFNIVRTLPKPHYDDEAWESLESLMRILLRAASEWKLVMAENGQVDYGEMSYRAIQSLGSEGAPTDLALRMDYRIQHLLVDEFQDTSASQIRLLERLTAGWSEDDGHTLFLVGDPMQSIYRFRKAEVSLFIKAWQRQLLDHIQLVPLQLTVNFRSTKPIVGWVNRTFPLVMPVEDDSVTGAVRYGEASTRPDASDEGAVTIQILPDRDDDEEARQVIELIGRHPEERSIAILVRARAHAGTILAELDKIKSHQPRFRYQAIKFTRLADTALVRDLVSLTLALIQPADRLAWLSLLRAPCVGLDLADLDTLVAGNSENIILDALSASIGGEGISDDGRARLQRVGPVLLHAVNRRGRQSVRSLVESTWITLGGPSCLDNASEMDDASIYFDLLESMEEENLPIDRDSLNLGLENLYAQPDADANGNLQVLTIYEAKGLQFDMVILPGLNRRPGGNNNKLLHWFELAGENRIVMSPMRSSEEKEKLKKAGDLIEFITFVEKQRQALEDSRLLYVAATRAKQNLHLFAAIKPNARGDIKPDAASLMGSLWPAIWEQQTPLILQANEGHADPGEQKEVPPVTLPQIYRRLKADWQLPEPPSSVPLHEIAHAEAQGYIEFSWAGEGARLAGNLVHRMLQAIGEQGVDRWATRGGMTSHHDWCRQQLASQGVRAEKADIIIERASLAMDNCLASERGRWILQNHEDARCEYAITAVLDGQLENFVLDRTFVENGIRWIIDYKTSSHAGGGLDDFLENEADRYRGQMRRYRDAMALTETRPIKTALYFPLLDRLKELD